METAATGGEDETKSFERILSWFYRMYPNVKSSFIEFGCQILGKLRVFGNGPLAWKGNKVWS